MQIVDKPWGREVWVAHTDRYALKIIEFNAGARCSLQYHHLKHEHVYVDKGTLRAELEDDQGNLTTRDYAPGDVIENPPGRRHRFLAITDVRIIEVSTPELDDVVRLEDDYGR